jgi:hypothetical protein
MVGKREGRALTGFQPPASTTLPQGLWRFSCGVRVENGCAARRCDWVGCECQVKDAREWWLLWGWQQHWHNVRVHNGGRIASGSVAGRNQPRLMPPAPVID